MEPLEQRILEKYGLMASGAGTGSSALAARLEAEAERNEAWVLRTPCGPRSVVVGKLEVGTQGIAPAGRSAFKAAVRLAVDHARVMLAYDPTLPAGWAERVDVALPRGELEGLSHDAIVRRVVSAVGDACRTGASTGPRLRPRRGGEKHAERG